MCHCLIFSLEILPCGTPGFPVGSPPTMPGSGQEKWIGTRRRELRIKGAGENSEEGNNTAFLYSTK